MRVDDLIDKIIANKDKWAYLALSRVEADMKTRVFNEGKDINEVGLGKYSPKYAKYRKDNSKQISFKDLEFDGQEKQTKKNIFKLSPAEKKAAIETFKLQFEQSANI